MIRPDSGGTTAPVPRVSGVMNSLVVPRLPAPAAVTLALESHTVRGAMRELHAKMADAGPVRDRAALWQAFEERLALGANCLSPEVAIPHVRSTTVSEIIFAVGRSAHGVEVDKAHPSVRLVFLVAAPPSQIDEYLAFMAALSRRLKWRGTIDALLRAEAEPDFRAILANLPGM